MALARSQDATAPPASLGANLRVKALSEVVVRGAQLALLVGLARTWGPERFGLFSFVGSLAAIAIVSGDFGLQLFLARAIAQGGGRPALAAAVRAKLLLSVLTLIALVAVSALYPRPEIRAPLFAAGAMVLAQSWCDLWNHYFRGRHSLRDEALLNVTYLVGGALVAGLAVSFGAGVLAVYQVLLAAALIGCWVGRRRVWVLAARDPADAQALAASRAGAPPPTAFDALRAAAPIGVATVLGTIYFRSDMVLLQWLRGDLATGAYAAAYRFFEGAFLLPALILAVLFPTLAGRMAAPRLEIERLLRRALRRMTLLGFGTAALLALAVAPLLRTIYGEEYAESAFLLRILAPGLCFVFPNFVLTHFLVAAGRQHASAWLAGLGVPVCLALNLALIPHLGARGAAGATVVTEVVLCAAAWIVARSTIARLPLARAPLT